MAKNKKRAEYRKELKQKKIVELQRLGINYKNLSDREIESLKLSDLKNGDYQQKTSNREYRKNLRNRKHKKLIDIGVDTLGFSNNDLNKIKIKDINRRDFNPLKYPKYFKNEDNYDFNFDKNYILKNNTHLYIAYRDYTQESTWSDILADFRGKPIKDLLSFLKFIVMMPTTSRADTSNGKAGDYIFQYGSYSNLKKIDYNDRVKKNKRKATRLHKGGEFKGFQVLKNGNKLTHTNVCGRCLLEVINALMYNIAEHLRSPLYLRFYSFINEFIPEMLKYIHTP